MVGSDMEAVPMSEEPSPMACQTACETTTACKAFTFSADKKCFLQKDGMPTEYLISKGSVSGPKTCGTKVNPAQLKTHGPADVLGGFVHVPLEGQGKGDGFMNVSSSRAPIDINSGKPLSLKLSPAVTSDFTFVSVLTDNSRPEALKGHVRYTLLEYDRKKKMTAAFSVDSSDTKPKTLKEGPVSLEFDAPSPWAMTDSREKTLAGNGKCQGQLECHQFATSLRQYKGNKEKGDKGPSDWGRTSAHFDGRVCAQLYVSGTSQGAPILMYVDVNPMSDALVEELKGVKKNANPDGKERLHFGPDDGICEPDEFVGGRARLYSAGSVRPQPG
mmetsp:Transcript_45597/g.128740  ORF Transcript_45597/g.128740 Transcript_45597/m.128740 type:complete len:330 (-) Transcript_45597:1055-2044(-)